VPLRPAPGVGRSTQRHLGCQTALGTRAEPPMSMPLAYPSTLDRRPRVCTSAGRRHRGGALEPESRTLAGIRRQKLTLMSKRNFGTERRSSLSLSGGASIRSRAFSS